MRKVLIVGIVASGKTTFTKKLSSILDIPYYELDNIAHNAKLHGRPKRTSKEQMEIIRSIDVDNHWVFEGVYRESHKDLYYMADTIIYLDMPLGLRKKRIIGRFIKQQIKLETCHYKSDLRMLKLMFKWTRNFERDRSNYEKFLNNFEERLIWLKSKDDVTEFLKGQESLSRTSMHNIT